MAMPILCRLKTRLKTSSTPLTITYSVPKGIGISWSSPLIRLWNGSTPKAAILKKPTAIAQMMTPHRDMPILRARILFMAVFPSCDWFHRDDCPGMRCSFSLGSVT